jgi:hypothetical protein
MAGVKELLNLGRFTREELERMLRAASAIRDTSARIEFISGELLGTPYEGSTLIGSAHESEAFVVNLESMDCFTFIDYIEAMRLSDSFARFCEHLKMVRYKHGTISFETRMHFFSDWLDTPRVRDVTAEIGGERVEGVTKTLNRKGDGSAILPGIPEKERRIGYIPSSVVDEGVSGLLRTGDYCGVYTEVEGLDVSHVGVIVVNGGHILFRHASSIEKRVLDQDFLTYMTGKPGIMVLRPIE